MSRRWRDTSFSKLVPRKEKLSVGPPGIEPGLHRPERCVLPVYYGPFINDSSIKAQIIQIVYHIQDDVARKRTLHSQFSEFLAK